MQSADFFRADNPEGMEARNEVNIHENDLLLWVDHMIIWPFYNKIKNNNKISYLSGSLKICHLFCE